LEGEIFLLGIWKNFEELEDSLSLAELYQLQSSSRDKDHEHRKFAAALKGIDIDEREEAEDAFKQVERRAQAKLSGMTEEQIELADIGVEIIIEE